MNGSSREKTRTWTATITGTGEIGTIPAIPGDTIEWVNVGTVQHFVSIWVPNEEVFGRHDVATGEGLPFQATILDTAPQGTPGIPRVYEYVIYDHTTGRFVEGKSHPKIEIPIP
jgi:plastocyanin